MNLLKVIYTGRVNILPPNSLRSKSGQAMGWHPGDWWTLSYALSFRKHWPHRMIQWPNKITPVTWTARYHLVILVCYFVRCPMWSVPVIGRFVEKESNTSLEHPYFLFFLRTGYAHFSSLLGNALATISLCLLFLPQLVSWFQWPRTKIFLMNTYYHWNIALLF